MHPLNGAYVRLDRANEHLAELKSLNKEFINREVIAFAKSLQTDVKVGETIQAGQPFFVQGLGTREPIPHLFPIVIGEIVYNLRACLDYLAYELAILDSGSEQNGTQFPIEDKSEGFRGRRKSYLKGINDPHTAAIERLQPYNGADWSRHLRTISNPDKHRRLVVSDVGGIATMSSGPESAEPPDSNHPGLFLQLEGTMNGQKMYMHLHLAFFIAFEDDLPVIDTLEDIKAQVANTLAQFKPEF